MTVYIDTNVFVYAISNRAELGERARAILRQVEDSKIDAATSCMTFSEIVHVLIKISDRKTAVAAGEGFLALNNLNIEGMNKTTCRIALETINQSAIRPQDALHYATMKEAGITEIITEDSDFDKIKGIRKYSIKEALAKFGKGNRQ